MINKTGIKTDTKKIKSELRKVIKSRLAAVLQQHLTATGNFAALMLSAIPGWDNFRSVLLFSSMKGKGEIDTMPVMETILNAKKSVFFPQIKREDLIFYRDTQTADAAGFLAAGDFPVLVITPGLAFDQNLNRLGRGRSFYDRFFAALDAAGRNYTALGLCMNCQLVEKIPVDPWDKKMDLLLTETGFIF